MIKQNLLYFSQDDLFDLQEAYENRLFEHQQFILSKVPISKIFEPRFEKIKKFHDEYVSLGGYFFDSPITFSDVQFNEQTIKESFHKHHAIRNQFKLMIMQIPNAIHLIEIGKKMVEIEKKYSKIWKLDVYNENVIVSKEPDPMDLLASILEFELMGYTTFQDLKNNINKAPEVLKTEANRLSLLFNKY